MAFINGYLKPNLSKTPNINLVEPLSSNKLLYETKLDNYMNFHNFIKTEDHQKIVEVMKKTRFTYQSIFLVENLFPEESNNLKNQIQKETSETQILIHQVERKGFSSIQYSANNPIEDSLCSFSVQQLNAFVVSVFDGHGGSQLSRFCAKNMSKHLRKFIKNSLKLHKYQNNKIQLIKDALFQAHLQLQNQYYKNHYLNKIKQDKKKYKGVGTCAITLVMYEGKCIVATCGDSQSIIISQDRGSYAYQKLSQRFSVNNKAQRQRIINQFKDIDQNIVVEERKNVFYLKGMLQPTKSIGDYYLKHKQHYIGSDEFKGPYLSCQPDIKVYDIKQHDKYIIIASDGLWDYFNKWQILKFVIQSKSKKDKLSIAQRETQSQNQDQNDNLNSQPTSIVQHLVNKVLQKVSNDFDFDISYLQSLQLGQRRSYHDDITIGIIDLQEFFQNLQKKNLTANQ